MATVADNRQKVRSWTGVPKEATVGVSIAPLLHESGPVPEDGLSAGETPGSEPSPRRDATLLAGFEGGWPSARSFFGRILRFPRAVEAKLACFLIVVALSSGIGLGVGATLAAEFPRSTEKGEIQSASEEPSEIQASLPEDSPVAADPAGIAREVISRQEVARGLPGVPAEAETADASAAESMELDWPATGRISSHFGMREGRMHEGIDIAVWYGVPIKAAKAGRVAYAGWRGTYGNTVILDHGGGLTTLYAHLGEVAVRPSQLVERHVTIGKCGSTGNSKGPHLHFEVRLSGRPVDPLRFLSSP